MDHNELATMCHAMGDPTRARIVLFLLDCCCPVAVGEGGEVAPFDGATAGQVCCHLTGEERISSTVSFHLKVLREAGLVTTERRGKYMVCGVNREALAKLAAFFTQAGGNCCSGNPNQG
ncbi:transcriptional regulator [bacterium]|nr:MAG: transcriptional regulator [bacterium]